MRRSELAYDLPHDLIAQFPSKERGDDRLLCLDGTTGGIVSRHFSDLPSLLNPEDLLVFNDTRVIRARFFGHKPTGGQVEVLVERVLDERRALAQVRASKSPKIGGRIWLGGGVEAEVIGRADDLFELYFHGPLSLCEAMARFGHVPLPPYILRADETEDEERYQTIFARRDGAVAAPTAGLHFDESMLGRLKTLGVRMSFVTLHVGAGTFQPIRVERVEEHVMHSELAEVSQEVCEQVRDTRVRGGRVIAVGTTVTRALEAAAQGGELRPFAGDTNIFITPGFRFRVVDALITNFHLPESTLLMLVSAFAGRERVLDAYRHAVESRYRFFSYGDAMFVTSGHAV
jgi:S-adenosylmethionine:tRNA ribosyltransferase-isomerase